MVIYMSGYRLKARFYPLVPTLERLVEEAKEGAEYPFTVQQVLQLRPGDYDRLCYELDKEYDFERMLPAKGYDVALGSFNCALVMPVNGRQGLLMTRYANQFFVAHLSDCALLDLASIPCQRITLRPPQRARNELER